MYKVKELTAAEFIEISEQYPDLYFPIEQSPQWQKFDATMPGKEPAGLWAYFDGGTMVAVAAVTFFARRMRNFFVLNRGPIWLIENTQETEAQLIDTLIDQFGKDSRSALFIRMHCEFEQKKAQVAFETVNYDRTILVDINKDDDALVKSFSSTTRRRIKQATKAGVEIREISRADYSKIFASQLFPIMEETTERNNFRGFELEFYENMLESMPENTHLFVAYLEDEPLCWIISTEFHQHAVYYFGAGNAKARETFASFLIQYECMKAARDRGNKVWDLTGVSGGAIPNLENVTKFKMMFSKEVTVLPSTYDVPLKKLQYKAITTAINSRRKHLVDEHN